MAGTLAEVLDTVQELSPSDQAHLLVQLALGMHRAVAGVPADLIEGDLPAGFTDEVLALAAEAAAWRHDPQNRRRIEAEDDAIAAAWVEELQLAELAFF